jgi:WD40 repeat protein
MYTRFLHAFSRPVAGEAILFTRLFYALALCAGLCFPTLSDAAEPSAGAADTPKPVALLIANSSYPDGAREALKHPAKDIRKLADELTKRGFDVVDVGLDLSRAEMSSKLDQLYSRIHPGSAALIYFSGYGIQSFSRSYMIGSNAVIWSDNDVRRDGVDIQSVLDEMSARGAALKIAIIDASRKTPFESRFRGRSTGLAPVVGNKGSIVIYSAAPGTVTDDDDGENSLFMRTLLKGIQAPGLTVDEAFNKTRIGVSQASKGEQVPWVSSFVMTEVYINPPVPNAQNVPPAPPPPDPCAAAEVHWKSTEAMATRDAYADHLARFPSCAFVTLAQGRIKMIDDAAKATAEKLAAEKAAADKAVADKAASDKAAADKLTADKTAADKATADKLAADKAAADKAAAEKTARAEPAVAPFTPAACGVPPPDRPMLAMGGPFVPISIRPDFNAAKAVRTIVFSPDGSKLATAGDDGAIRLWDASSFRLVATLRQDQDPIYSLSFWRDGSLLASASATGTVRVWNLVNGRVNTFRAGLDSDGKSLRQFGVAFAPDRTPQFVDSVGDDGRVWIWDLQQNGLRKIRQQNPYLRPSGDPTIRSISFAPNFSGQFVTAGFDGAIRFYTGAAEPDAYPAYSGKALRVAYSPDGTRVVSAGVDKGLKNLKIWDAKTHRVIRNLDGHIDYVISADWSADGTRVISGGGGKDKAVRIWDAERGTQLLALLGHHDDVEAVAFHPRKDWVVSVSEDKTLKLWDIAQGREILSVVAFTDGEYLAYTPLGCYAGSQYAEQHFKVVAEGVARDVTADTRKAFFVAGGIAPLLTAIGR